MQHAGSGDFSAINCGYGAFDTADSNRGFAVKQLSKAETSNFLGLAGPTRRRFNGLAALQAILLPCSIFTGLLTLLSFFVERDHKALSIFVIICALLVGLAFAAKAATAWRRGCEGSDRSAQPSWFLFLAASCLTAWTGGVVLGAANYNGRMSPFYVLAGLGLAKDVDPFDIPGSKFLDASRILFKDGSKVSEEHALGFKDGSTYCVAPVVRNGTSVDKYASLDYWAVGIDCCTPIPPTRFWCGSADITDPNARGGVRWMGDRKFFELAIQQAEAEYGYKALHPIMFTWTKDPVGDVASLKNKGVVFVKTWIVVHLVLQVFATVFVVAVLTPSEAPFWLQQKSVPEAPVGSGPSSFGYPSVEARHCTVTGRGWG